MSVTNLKRAGPAASVIQCANPFAKLIKLHLQTPQALLAPRPLLDRLLLMLIPACCVIFRKQLSARKRWLEEKQQERLASKSRAPRRRAQHQPTPLRTHMADSPSLGLTPTEDPSSLCCSFLPNQRRTLPHRSGDARRHFMKIKMGPAKSGMEGNAER